VAGGIKGFFGGRPPLDLIAGRPQDTPYRHGVQQPVLRLTAIQHKQSGDQHPMLKRSSAFRAVESVGAKGRHVPPDHARNISLKASRRAQ